MEKVREPVAEIRGRSMGGKKDRNEWGPGTVHYENLAVNFLIDAPWGGFEFQSSKESLTTPRGALKYHDINGTPEAQDWNFGWTSKRI